MTVAIISLLTATVDTTTVMANPEIQISPLSPLPVDITSSSSTLISSTLSSAEDGEENVAEDLETAAENAQPESPLPIDVITSTDAITSTDVITSTEAITSTPTVAADEPPDETINVVAEPVDEAPVDQAPVNQAPIEDPVTESPILAPASSPQPTPITAPRGFAAMFATGQISLVLVGFLFVGFLVTMGLVLVRK